MSIYKYGECDYCSEENRVLRPSPYMIDAGAVMCEYCWEMTREEAENSTGEIIDKFDSVEGYKDMKENVITNENIKDILSNIAELNISDSIVEKFAIKRIEELENQLKEIYARANNAIYFNDSSDYVPYFYSIAKLINPTIDHMDIGTKYIEED